MDKQRLWKQTQAELQLSLSQVNYKLFFSNTKLQNIDKKANFYLYTISCPNLYIKDSIKKRYENKLIDILKRLNKNKAKVRLVIKKKTELKAGDFGPLFKDKKDEENKNENLAKTREAIKKAHLQPLFTFNNFAVSSSNEMAYAAAKAVSRTPGKAYTPLFFYGGVGVGKTHLMQAIVHQALFKNPKLKTLYCSGEEFTNEIIDAIQTKKTRFFRQKYRLVNILIIDDIQFIAGKNTVQEEFFHTFNAIHQEEGQIILSSDRPPSEIQKLEERLASRFEAGLIVDIQEPNFELRTAILLIKSKTLNLSLPMDVAQLIASKIKSTRQLEGALTKIRAFVQTQKKDITPDLADQILNLKSTQKTTQKPKARELVSQVAQYYNLKVSQLKGKERHQYITLPRQVAMFLLRIDANYTLVEIGQLFGGRDHTTVMHSVKKIQKLLLISEEIRFNVNSLRKNIF